MNTKAKSICFTLLFLAGTVALHAAQFGDFTYASSGTEITITGYTGPGGDVTIPETLEGLPVTEIGDYAFYGHQGLTGVLIPDSVKSIAGGWIVTQGLSVAGVRGAFSDCTGLTWVAIPDGVTRLEAGTFYGCTSLTSVVIPNTVTSIGGGAFTGCTSLRSVEIPTSVTNIEGGVFSGCASLTTVNIPERVTAIGPRAFDGVIVPGSLAMDDLDGAQGA